MFLENISNKENNHNISQNNRHLYNNKNNLLLFKIVAERFGLKPLSMLTRRKI